MSAFEPSGFLLPGRGEHGAGQLSQGLRVFSGSGVRVCVQACQLFRWSHLQSSRLRAAVVRALLGSRELGTQALYLRLPFFEQPVELSPDLARIAFVKETGQPTENMRELHLAANDGTGDWLYAKGVAIQFQGWSPEADRFAYTLGDTQELWLGSLKEAPRQPGGGMSGVQNLRWVDNQRFLFWQAVGGSLELALANLEGGTILLDSIVGGPEYDFIP